MDNALVQAQITEQLIRKLEESRFLHIPVMNRIEEGIRTREQFERYIAMLVLFASLFPLAAVICTRGDVG